MDQGTTKARGDEATIYQHAGDAKDAQGKDISGDIQRVILIGKKKQAHLEQQQDGGGLSSPRRATRSTTTPTPASPC